MMQATRSNTVYAQLKSEIVDWTLPPGTPLSEPDTARRLGASRTPVREALQRLHHEGLVRLISGRGAMVSDLSISTLVELFQVREGLEGYAARLAARSPDDARLRALLHDSERARDYVASKDFERFYALTESADQLISQLCANSRLERMLNEVWDQVVRARRLAAVNPTRLRESAQEHLGILRAIAGGDGDGADASARLHVRNSLANIITSLSGERPRDPGSAIDPA